MKINWREVCSVFKVVNATVDENSTEKSPKENYQNCNKVIDVK
jgi:hypothetical protein